VAENDAGHFSVPNQRVTSIVYTHNGRQIVSVAGTVLRLHDATSGKLIREMDDAALGDAIAVSPDDKWIASGHSGFGVFEADTGRSVLRSAPSDVIVDGLAFTSDKRLKCAYARIPQDGGLEAWIATWDINAGKEMRRLRLEFPKDAMHTIHGLSPDGRFLTSAVAYMGSLPGYGPPVYLWDAVTGKRLRQIGTTGAQAMSFSADGNLLATSGLYCPTQVWDVTTEKERGRIRQEGPSCIAFSPNGRFLATAEGRRAAIRVFELPSGKEIRTFHGHDLQVNSLCFSPDGRRLASGSDDSTVLVWELGDAGKQPPDQSRDGGSSLKVLQAYCGKDVRTLDEAESKRLIKAIETLVPGRHYTDEFFGFHPWYVWRFSKSQANEGYIIFDVENGLPHPSSTPMRTTVLSSEGALIRESNFMTGHRCYPKRAELQSAGAQQFPIIKLDTTNWGPPIYRQYYASIGSGFDLIRLESLNGQAVRNRYYVRHFRSGPEVSKQTEAEWESDVCGSDQFKVLRALVWLGGIHVTLKPKKTPDPQDEPLSDAELVERVRQRPKVIARLKELARSANKWEQEQAAQALDPVASRFSD
jgi:WD40 repeat protein